jgi:uncharacterized membrane protein
MRAPTLLLLLTLIAIVIFAAINWSVIMAPTSLSLVFATVQAPLGLIMLGLTALIVVLFLVFVVYLQTTVLLDSRRHARELQGQRQLADQAEASRLTDLRTSVEGGLRALGEQSSESRVTEAARLDQLERNLQATIEQVGNTLSAYIGELEDRLERSTGNRDRTSPPDNAPSEPRRAQAPE